MGQHLLLFYLNFLLTETGMLMVVIDQDEKGARSLNNGLAGAENQPFPSLADLSHNCYIKILLVSAATTHGQSFGVAFKCSQAIWSWQLIPKSLIINCTKRVTIHCFNCQTSSSLYQG